MWISAKDILLLVKFTPRQYSERTLLTSMYLCLVIFVVAAAFVIVNFQDFLDD